MKEICHYCEHFDANLKKRDFGYCTKGWFKKEVYRTQICEKFEKTIFWRPEHYWYPNN